MRILVLISAFLLCLGHKCIVTSTCEIVFYEDQQPSTKWTDGRRKRTDEAEAEGGGTNFACPDSEIAL